MLRRAASIPCLMLLAFAQASASQAGGVTVEILEGVPAKPTWEFTPPTPSETFHEPAFGLVGVPRKYSSKGVVVDRSNPLVLRAFAAVTLPAGEYRFLLRSRNAARLFMDGKVIAQNSFLNPNANGHEKVPDLPPASEGLPHLPIGHQQKIVTVKVAEGMHDFRVEVFIGGQRLRPELGELIVGAARSDEPFLLLGPGRMVALTEEDWVKHVAAAQGRLLERDNLARKTASVEEEKYWHQRHELAREILKQKPAVLVPVVADRMPAHNEIDRFIGKRLEEKNATPSELVDDTAFLRRLALDTVGVIPTREEIDAFRRDASPDRRRKAIDRYLKDPRWADNWVGYWQDVLAENPGILKPTLNNTGPFRWWLHQAFLDNLPMDRFATELVLMEGSRMYGGPGGFAIATENDVPMAAKAHILARAFLGVELGCARCHDAPNHPYKQSDTFNLAAMLNKGPQALPATSTVRVAEGARKPRVEMSLKAGTKVNPAWPFKELSPAEVPSGVLREKESSREKLAAILTSPHNDRFAQVIVNRLWKRYLGFGLVEPVDDWYGVKPSHPELLEHLGRELATHNYDLKHVARLILSSHVYQRQVRPEGSVASGPQDRLFVSPARRRLSAEQLVDSLFTAAGKQFGCEELTMDPEGRRPITEMMTLGTPRRAWELTSLSNERDRPALALPVVQSVVDVLGTFGWRDSRQNPQTVRDETPTPLQPLLLANGVVGNRISRLSDDSAFTELSLQDRPLTELVDAVFQRVLSRLPRTEERSTFIELLQEGYAERRPPGYEKMAKKRPLRMTAVSWANHLSPEATRIKLELERQAREGDPPTERLRPDWRERMEDMIWALVNTPEFMFLP